jgi:murein L,D-transpeptidase YafK
LNRSPIARTLLAVSAFGAAVVLSGCNTTGVLPMSERAARPLSEQMASEIASKNMDRDAPILVRTFKEESELEVWKQDRTGRFALLKSYPICRWSGELGPKIKEGDRQAPEGFYNITPGQMNPNSQYYLAFDLGFPNAYDRAHGRTGANLMVHGDCSSRGCYSMTDEQISEIYALGRDAFFGGQKSFQVQAYPFRMTPQNMAKHRSNPHMAFWKMLKKGNDHFEVTRLEPKVNFCAKHYVFDAEAPAGSTRAVSFNPSGRCPAYQVPPEIEMAVREKEQRDAVRTAELIRRGTPVAPIRTNADGGMHPVFVAAVKRNQIGVKPPDNFLLASAPGTIPATVRPPRIPELANAPVATADGPVTQPVSAPPVQAASVESQAQPSAPAANPGGLFGSLFASNASNATAAKDDTPIDRMGRLIGFGESEPKANAAAAVPKPRPKPAATRQTHVASHGAIRPRPAEPTPIRSAAAPAPRSAPAPAPSPWPAVAAPSTTAQAPAAAGEQATAQAKPQAKPQARPQAKTQAAAGAPVHAPNNALSGAAPVVPAGTFANRWSAFR